MIANGRDIIRAGYAAGTKVEDIARQCDSTPGSVRVIAKKMNLRHGTKKHLDIPVGLKSDYRILMDVGRYNVHEAMRLIGLEAAAQ